MYFLGSHQRKSVRRAEPHLVAENTRGTGTGTVAFESAVIEDMPEQIMVLLHVCKVQIPRPVLRGQRPSPSFWGKEVNWEKYPTGK
jgi:hypothetical protein